MVNVDYDSLRLHFDYADESQLRGRPTDAGLMAYAVHLLDRIHPKEGARLLDLGCGDGLLMAMMLKIRPDLVIDGIELSHILADQARDNNHRSNIFVGNALDMHLPHEKYDCIFSFSFLQYIPPEYVLLLQHRLVSMLTHEGIIIHSSVPDLRLKPVNIAEIQFRKYSLHAWWRTPLIVVWSYLQGLQNSYSTNAFWHDPLKLMNQLEGSGSTSILPGDVYYRFDVKTIYTHDLV